MTVVLEEGSLKTGTNLGCEA